MEIFLIFEVYFVECLRGVVDEVEIVDDVEVVGGVEVLGGVVVDLVEEVEDFVDFDGVGKIVWEFFGV